MCGICGLYIRQTRDQPSEALLRRMTDTLAHRGPDDAGVFLDQQVGLGHRRLSIIDLETGHQPIFNEDKTLAIVCNGEIYNYQELRTELKGKGHLFHTQSDTEVIIHLYEEKGVDCLSHLRGMFAFALWDGLTRTLFLARDRLGIKPLFYALGPQGLVFGSELKAILQAEWAPRDIDVEALHHYLLFDYIAAPHTIFQAVKKLPPAHYLLAQGDQASVEPYWELAMNEPLVRGEEETAELLRSTLQSVVKEHLVSDVPVGAFLSGGIDSSSVVALMARAMDQPVKTFSIGFEDQSYNELPYARLVAERFQTEHREELVKPNMVDLVPKLIEYVDEPFADTSLIPTYLVSSLARKEVKVVLSGDGGDELFGGYDNYLAQRLDRYYRLLPNPVRNLITQSLERIPPSPAKKGIINKLKRFVEGSNLPEEGRHCRWMTFFSPEELLDVCSAELRSEMKSIDFYGAFQDYFNQVRDEDPLRQAMFVDIKTWIPDDILAKVDRMSMAVGLEARVPLLDHAFVEFAAQIPSVYKVKGLDRKHILKKAMQGMLPGAILNRKEKQGFSIPIKNWLRHDLKEMLMDTLSPERVARRGFFSPNYVSRIVHEHLEETHDHWHRLWALLVFDLWSDGYNVSLS
ncbi:MAG: asparagine synthase (glutamine-hydrolyzing) [Chloroflexi bacterium]|nr:asparagine synthase (glutamine-hydrolyzing) [Chloroflexota bacterium]MCL5075281.1 asparagine synthase (glutamine-hydrolyzing) [Chloroflexota bacterium]